MSISGIYSQLLDVTVVGCSKLKDTEWISRQDPYVCLEYGSTKFRTKTCTDGGKNPRFQEKFVFSLIEGLREINVVVWNSNTITFDDFIGSGKVQLQKVLSQGYDDSSWPLQTKNGRNAGEVKLILHYANANKLATGFTPSGQPYAAPPVSHVSHVAHASHVPPYSTAPPISTATYPLLSSYPAPAPTPTPYPSYEPNSAGYPPSTYPPQHQVSYPPAPYPQTSAYPPPPYPPPPQASPYYPPGPYPGTYPRPPY